jgi:hypothetical protein
VCRKAPAAVAVQGRHQVPPRFHKGARRPRSGGAGPDSPRTCCQRTSAAGSPGPYGSLSCRAVLECGSVHCRSGLWAAGTCAKRQSGRRIAGWKTGGGTAVGGAGSYLSMTPPCRPCYLPACTGPARLFRPGRDSTYYYKYAWVLSRTGTESRTGTNFQ